MNRLKCLSLFTFFSLTVAALPMLPHPFQTPVGDKPERFSAVVNTQGRDRMYATTFTEKEVLDADGKKKVRIVLKVISYTGYCWAANADSTDTTSYYTLERVGAPVKTGDYSVITWKLIKTEGNNVLKGRLVKTVKMTLDPQKDILVQFSDIDSIRLESELVERDPYDDW